MRAQLEQQGKVTLLFDLCRASTGRIGDLNLLSLDVQYQMEPGSGCSTKESVSPHSKHTPRGKAGLQQGRRYSIRTLTYDLTNASRPFKGNCF